MKFRKIIMAGFVAISLRLINQFVINKNPKQYKRIL